MKRFLSVLLVFALLHALQPEPAREAKAQAGFIFVVSIAAIASCAIIYVYQRSGNHEPALHLMVLQKSHIGGIDPRDWTSVSTNLVPVNTQNRIAAFADNLHSDETALYRVIDLGLPPPQYQGTFEPCKPVNASVKVTDEIRRQAQARIR